MIEKGSFVRIRRTILSPKERSTSTPIETQQVPFKMWVKGYLLEESEMFEYSSVKTATGRIEKGRIKEFKPTYKTNYGDFVPEALQLREIILGDFNE